MSRVNKQICNYIASEWISDSDSNRAFALDHDIDEKVVRKICKEEGYRIPVETLKRICDSREISLEVFFQKLKI